MKKTFIILLLAISFSNCKHEVHIPKGSYIDDKFIVFSPIISKVTILDSSKVRDFDMKYYMDFGFRVDKKMYDIEYELELDKSGHLKHFSEYRSPNSYLYKKAIKRIQFNYDSIGFKTLIKFSSSREYIIDGDDTIKIEKVFPKQKLVLVGKDEDLRNYFYHYK